MSHALAARSVERGCDATGYQRHRPERTLLYRIVEQHYPAFAAHLAGQGTNLPDYVRREFEEYLRCGRLEHGFMRVRCDECRHEHLVAFSCKRRGFCPSCGALHAGVAARADERKKLERLCRYISRPAVSEKRLSLTANGNIRYRLKTPYRDGTTHVILLRASCPPPYGPACGCSKLLQAILSNPWTSSPGLPPWCRSHART